MGIIVAKFGGTSLSCAEQFCKVRDIILSDTNRRYVIPSAPGKRYSDDTKITDLLYLCHERAGLSLAFDDIFDVITGRYMDIVHGLNLDLDLEAELNNIKTRIREGASADYTASRGEYLNGLILARLLGYDFLDAADIIFLMIGEYLIVRAQMKR